MKELKALLKKQQKDLLNELDMGFMPIPSGACNCGKPIVFPNEKKIFTCTRCGNRYELKIEIVQRK